MSPRAPLGRILVKAAFRPLNLGIGAVGLSMALALALAGAGPGPSGALLGLALVTWLGLVAWDTFLNPTLRQEASFQAPSFNPRAPEVVPLPLEEGPPPELRRSHEQVFQASLRIRQAMDESGDVLQSQLGETWSQCSHLVEDAGRMVERGYRLYAYLRSVNPTALRQEIRELHEKAHRTRDEGAARAWLQAAQARQQQVEAWQAIEGLYERVKAQLTALHTRLEEVHARVIRMNALDQDQARAESASLSVQLKSLDDEVTVLERAMADVLGGSPPHRGRGEG